VAVVLASDDDGAPLPLGRLGITESLLFEPVTKCRELVAKRERGKGDKEDDDPRQRHLERVPQRQAPRCEPAPDQHKTEQDIGDADTLAHSVTSIPSHPGAAQSGRLADNVA